MHEAIAKHQGSDGILGKSTAPIRCGTEVVAEYDYGSTKALGTRGVLDDFPEPLLQMTNKDKHDYQCPNPEATACG